MQQMLTRNKDLKIRDLYQNQKKRLKTLQQYFTPQAIVREMHNNEQRN